MISVIFMLFSLKGSGRCYFSFFFILGYRSDSGQDILHNEDKDNILCMDSRALRQKQTYRNTGFISHRATIVS